MLVVIGSISSAGGGSPNASRMTIGVMTEYCSGLVLVSVFNQVFVQRQPDDLSPSCPVECNQCPSSEIRPNPHAPSWIFRVPSPMLIAAIDAGCRAPRQQRPMQKGWQQAMKLVSSWSHFLNYECNDCGESTYVDAARKFSTTVACRSSKCRTFPKKLEALAHGNRSVLIGLPAGKPRCRQPWTA